MPDPDGGPAPADPRSAPAWRWRRFDDLSPAALYEILAAREAAFVVEQRCAYQEVDGLDAGAWHLTGHTGGALAAYARLLPPGVRFPEPSIGRVVVTPPHRGAGLGRALMREAMAGAARIHPGAPLRVMAQAHLRRFYETLGFRVVSDPYDEDGIPHVDMLLPPG